MHPVPQWCVKVVDLSVTIWDVQMMIGAHTVLQALAPFVGREAGLFPPLPCHKVSRQAAGASVGLTLVDITW